MAVMRALPEGYRVTLGERPPWLFEPVVLTLKRPDGSIVANFAPGGRVEAVKRTAWRDHRERTLRLLDGEMPRP
jgi:hypothetical protein